MKLSASQINLVEAVGHAAVNVIIILIDFQLILHAVDSKTALLNPVHIMA